MLEPLDDRVLVLPDPVNTNLVSLDDFANPDLLTKNLGQKAELMVVKQTLGPSYGEQGRGRVVAVGQGCEVNDRLLPMTVAVGDQVLYSMGAGHELPVDGVMHRMFREEELMAILNRKC